VPVKVVPLKVVENRHNKLLYLVANIFVVVRPGYYIVSVVVVREDRPVAIMGVLDDVYA
jgi:hypothetical protein